MARQRKFAVSPAPTPGSWRSSKSRNFGIIRSSNLGLLQARGDATINMASDMQEPPELIGDFIRKWEQMSFGLAPILIGFFFFASV